MNMVSADYLNALSIPLRQGRMLTEREIDAAEPLAVVNESAAKLWPAEKIPLDGDSSWIRSKSPARRTC